MVSQRLQVICLIDYFMQLMNPPGSTSHWLLPSGVAALSWVAGRISVAIPHGTGQIDDTLLEVAEVHWQYAVDGHRRSRCETHLYSYICRIRNVQFVCIIDQVAFPVLRPLSNRVFFVNFSGYGIEL